MNTETELQELIDSLREDFENLAYNLQCYLNLTNEGSKEYEYGYNSGRRVASHEIKKIFRKHNLRFTVGEE